MADKEKTTDTYKVEHDPITDLFTGGEGTKGERVESSETNEETGKTDTYKVEHDPITDILTGGEGTKGDRVETSETDKKDAA
jgi:N-acetylmuramic acid 6-phosphate (MurNAc-6-P) etherase